MVQLPTAITAHKSADKQGQGQKQAIKANIIYICGQGKASYICVKWDNMQANTICIQTAVVKLLACCPNTNSSVFVCQLVLHHCVKHHCVSPAAIYTKEEQGVAAPVSSQFWDSCALYVSFGIIV
jgi:hypothetical protein